VRDHIRVCAFASCQAWSYLRHIVPLPNWAAQAVKTTAPPPCTMRGGGTTHCAQFGKKTRREYAPKALAMQGQQEGFREGERVWLFLQNTIQQIRHTRSFRKNPLNPLNPPTLSPNALNESCLLPKRKHRG
jgi:hypothetical protein